MDRVRDMIKDDIDSGKAGTGTTLPTVADTGLETGVEETPPAGGGAEEGGAPELELASVKESELPLILEKLDNNNFNLDKGRSNLKEVSNKLESLLED